MEHRGAVGLVGKGLHNVHVAALARLDADKLLSDFVAGHRAQSYIGVLHLVLALLEVAGHKVVSAQGLALFKSAELLEQVLLVVVLGLFGDLHLIIGDAVFCRDVNLELGIEAKVVLEGEALAVLPVVVKLLLAGQRLAYYFQLVLLDVLAQGIAHQGVDHISHGLRAIEFLYQRHRGHTLAEALYVCLAAEAVEFFLFRLGPVGLLYGDGQRKVEVVGSVFC